MLMELDERRRWFLKMKIILFRQTLIEALEYPLIQRERRYGNVATKQEARTAIDLSKKNFYEESEFWDDIRPLAGGI